MANFPSSLPSYTGFTSSHTLSQDSHASQHNSEQGDITAIATKVGTGASTPTSGTFLRGNGVGTSAWGQVGLATSDVSGILPASNGGTGVSSISALALLVLPTIYPVGCVYTETTGTNPGTTFGFGVWAAYGQGRVLVGYKSGDSNFGTAGATGGETTHILTSSEMPSHTHTQNSHSHAALSVGGYYAYGGASGNPASGTGFGTQLNSLNTGTTTATNQNTGGDNSHNNLQPFIVVYMWIRNS